MQLTKGTPDRLHLDLKDGIQVRAFLKHCNVAHDKLMKAVEKVGHSLAALRKELCPPEQYSSPSEKR